MSLVIVKASRTADVAPAAVYGFLSDFTERHPRILPSNFTNYRVEEGGVGTGTAVSYHFRAGRRERDYRMAITADEPTGRIVEKDRGSSLETTWTLVPRANGTKTDVEIRTRWEGASGIGGFFERTFAPIVLRRIYDEQLTLLIKALAGERAGRD